MLQNILYVRATTLDIILLHTTWELWPTYNCNTVNNASIYYILTINTTCFGHKAIIRCSIMLTLLHCTCTVQSKFVSEYFIFKMSILIYKINLQIFNFIKFLFPSLRVLSTSEHYTFLFHCLRLAFSLYAGLVVICHVLSLLHPRNVCCCFTCSNVMRVGITIVCTLNATRCLNTGLWPTLFRHGCSK
jgi:hypothetical protein